MSLVPLLIVLFTEVTKAASSVLAIAHLPGIETILSMVHVSHRGGRKSMRTTLPDCGLDFNTHHPSSSRPAQTICVNGASLGSVAVLEMRAASYGVEH